MASLLLQLPLPLKITLLLAVAFTFALAWVVGLVVPAAPGGLGVFESIILLGLGSKLPEAPLLASLLCYRLVSTLADVLAAFIYPLRRLILNIKLN